MDTKRTISYLNSKMWYRFLKVSFILVFITIILTFNVVNIIEVGIREIDEDKTLIYCNGGDRRVLIAKQVGRGIYSHYNFQKEFDYKKFYEDDRNKHHIIAILQACSNKRLTHDLDIYKLQRVYEIRGFGDSPKNFDEAYLKEQIEKMANAYKETIYLDYSIHFFDIKPVYTYKRFILSFFIGNFSILLSFEALRRIFYYIALGAIKPKK